VRNRFADVFYDLGLKDERLCMVVADISPAGSITRFREEFPDRFINTGVAEQVMIGLAAGMALRGLRPFAYTIATFALYRPYEFIRDDLCYQNLPVTIVGIGGGVTYSTLGGTHHAMEDIAIASALPNMSVIAPIDPDETEAATRWCATQTRGPVYLRLGKAGEPDLSKGAETEWEFGKPRLLQRGEDVLVLTYGPMSGVAWDVVCGLRAKGRSVSFVSCHTLKPLDTDTILDLIRAHGRTVIIEETTPEGSLGQSVKASLYNSGIDKPVDTFSLKNEFIHSYGSHAELLAVHGLSAAAILEKLDA
jgi:transketolase